MNFDELIQKEEKALLRDLRELVRIPSVSVPGTGRAPYGAECRRALDWFLSRASEMGFQTRDVDGHCGWCEYGEGEEMVAVLCHLDVVPAGDGWHYPPYDCTWAGGRIYGRGVIDDKGPAAAALYALKAVRDSGAPLASPGAPAGGVQRGEGLLLHPPLCGGRRRDPGDGLHPGRHVPHYQRGEGDRRGGLPSALPRPPGPSAAFPGGPLTMWCLTGPGRS